MSIMKDKCTEVQFIYIINKWLAYDPTLVRLKTTVKYMLGFGTFNGKFIYELATRCLLDESTKLSNIESCVILWFATQNYKLVCDATGYTTVAVAERVQDFVKDPFPIKLRFTEEERKEIKGFLDAINNCVRDYLGGMFYDTIR